MVRTKEKKAKGDGAFTKRKQKVGRKKLAPATATRAEVHARTLRLSTSAAMTAAMAAPRVADPAQHPPSSATAAARQKAAQAETRKRPVIAVQNFAELLAGTHHYKSAQRASSFATLTRVLAAQKVKEDAAAAARAASTRGESSGAFEEYMRYAASEEAPAGKSSTSGTSAGLSRLTALEKLKAFATALEAVTDTDDDVRRGALQSLEVLVDFQWISSERDRHAGISRLPSVATTQDAAELERCNALLLDVQSGKAHEAERVLAASSSSSTTAGASVASAAAAAPSTVSVDRVQAILQSVHVALTHALKSVRLTGVELLALLLRVAPPALVRVAARAVCRHQTAYYYSSPAAVMGGMMGSGVAMAGAPRTSKKGAAGDPSSSPAPSAMEAAQSRAAAAMEEEEKWVLTLVRRVSALVLRTKHIGVLPALLGVFLRHSGDASSAGEEAVVADLLRSCVDERTAHDGGRGAETRAAAAATATTVPMMADSARPVWRHPELVSQFFDEVAPQWANHWKELMELRLELLRQEDRLATASALARSFATVLVFLKRQQRAQGGYVKDSKVNFFSRNRMSYIKALFIDKMPVTMQELLQPFQGSAATAVAAPATSAVSPRSMKARLELGLALVMVCVPLAGTEEGWHLMRDYFSIVLSLPRQQQQPAAEGGGEAVAKGNGGSPAVSATSNAAQSFRFPSVALLEMSVRLYEQVLRLYPCTAAHVRLADDGDDAEGTASGNATTEEAKALWGEPSVSRASLVSFQQQQHSTVAIRLLSLFPALLNAVIKHVVPRTECAGASLSASASSEDAALVRTLLCTSHILERLAAFPDDLLRGRSTRHNGSDLTAASTTADRSAAAKKLEEGFGLVPRLLFALRAQTSVSRPAAVKHPRADDDEKGEGEGENEAGAAADRSAPSLPLPAETRVVGVLLAYPGVVDALVRRLLRVLWFLCSSGHPLLTRTDTSDSKEATDISAPPLALLLKRSVPFLFGNAAAGVAGVLQRCAVPTVLLAHSILYYLGEEERRAGEEATALADAAVRWADVREVLRALRV
ncbi:hypothetical protein ABB37_08809 [Leptomonas pyrrhocoris]|uniref:Uncharacterized protein n=1 Tax=Leptomonas pyrrhocoris TaxID=157538 RepID=A0A0M9FSU1_LEPPY|nr:hypothetical protein ABB37_08809 [Leptomonas pyrrhocoris]KPA75146.1 hypothetical protein ABB37_08809 [Leptomonas pyrrhocoris]|eukprot:XP_015653585.1 hypothetical protein ABB37_08809 [Leptomonas pyrrhocoris]